MVAYGSKGNPVAQDPFQQIVEVHWSPKYLAVAIGVFFAPQRGDPLENFSVIGPDFVSPYSVHYVPSIEAGPASVQSVHVGNSGHWSSISTSDVVASDLPSPSSVSLDPWQWNWEDGPGTKGPFDQWHAGAGIDGPYVEGPSGVGDFNQGLDPSIVLKGQRFLEGAPKWTPFFTNAGQWGTGETDGGPFVPLISEIGSQAFSLSGLSVIYKDKTWRPIASKVSGVTGNTEGALTVLLKREEVTP